MVRMYFNKRGPKDSLPWSVDYGDQSSEIQVRTIHLERVTGDVKFDPKASYQGIEPATNPRSEVPKAWIEFPDAELEISRGRARIFAREL